ncbi:MAG: hypothetical protein K2K98_02940 [Muribaculaceae bacterium]|nr:hypothetical protein [Muribaculaceae bacterium]
MSKHNFEHLTDEDLASLHNCLETGLKILSEHYQKSATNEDVEMQPLHDAVTYFRELKFEAFNQIDERKGSPNLRAKQVEAYNGYF